MKVSKKYLIILVCFILFVYITNIEKIPSEIILFQNEEYEISCLKGIKVLGENLTTSNNFFRNLTKIASENIGNKLVTVSAFGGVMKKDVNINVLPTTSVILGGDTVGIKVYSEGVLVVGMMPVQGENGKEQEPYKNTKIEIGDIVTKLNNQSVESISEMVEILDGVSSGEEIEIEYMKNGCIVKEKILPVQSFEDGESKLGLWVRDGVMGVGTLTYYNPSTERFAALGHGVSDYDTKKIIVTGEGSVNIAKILDIKKGAKNSPGEIKGLLIEELEIGTIKENSENGIFGEIAEIKNYFRGRRKVDVASKNEIKIGEASIFCTVDNDDCPKEYDIEILKVSDENSLTEGMIIKVIDDELLEKTGGIIQGMSGSPIIQNGKLIGAVTHVYVSDPTKGYGVFIENMLN